jgi:hypothetical protein
MTNLLLITLISSSISGQIYAKTPISHQGHHVTSSKLNLFVLK